MIQAKFTKSSTRANIITCLVRTPSTILHSLVRYLRPSDTSYYPPFTDCEANTSLRTPPNTPLSSTNTSHLPSRRLKVRYRICWKARRSFILRLSLASFNRSICEGCQSRSPKERAGSPVNQILCWNLANRGKNIRRSSGKV